MIFMSNENQNKDVNKCKEIYAKAYAFECIYHVYRFNGKYGKIKLKLGINQEKFLPFNPMNSQIITFRFPRKIKYLEFHFDEINLHVVPS